MSNKNEKGISYGTGRTRNWATIVYPESAPENWKDILGELKMEAFVSPLHDQDLNPGGELKKPHYHVLLMFPSVKTDKQAADVFQAFGGVGTEQVASLRGYARYLCHLDNPEKHIYDTKDVLAFGGADYYSVITLVTDKYLVLAEILDFCDENHIVYYSDLIRWCRQNKFEWFRALVDGGTYVVKEYLKSSQFERTDCRNLKKKNKEKKENED